MLGKYLYNWEKEKCDVKHFWKELAYENLRKGLCEQVSNYLLHGDYAVFDGGVCVGVFEKGQNNWLFTGYVGFMPDTDNIMLGVL